MTQFLPTIVQNGYKGIFRSIGQVAFHNVFIRAVVKMPGKCLYVGPPIVRSIIVSVYGAVYLPPFPVIGIIAALGRKPDIEKGTFNEDYAQFFLATRLRSDYSCRLDYVAKLFQGQALKLPVEFEYHCRFPRSRPRYFLFR